MRIVLDDGAGQRELAVEAAGPDVTIADVVAAADCEPGDVVVVGGRRLPTSLPIAAAAIPDGAVVRLRPPATERPSPLHASHAPRLGVVAGPGTGAAVALDRVVVVGRAPTCDLVVPSSTVEGRHCRVVHDGMGRVTVTDLAPVRGTWVGTRLLAGGSATAGIGEVLRIGTVVLRVEPAAAADRPRRLDPVRHLGTGRAVPFNRPPRPGPPPPVSPVDVPEASGSDAAVPPLHVAALLTPIVLGGVMVVLLGSWRYAAVMALGPVLLLATTLSARRRARRGRRARTRADRAELEVFAATLSSTAEAARRRRWTVLPSASEVVRRALQPSTRLWERRLGDDDALLLGIGVGPVPWQPPLRADRGAPRMTDEARAVLEQWDRLPRCPVPVSLAHGGVVGIVGDRECGAAVARSLLLQACVHHGPADVHVAIAAAAAHVGDWAWASWLPHTVDHSGRRRLATGAIAGRRLIASLRERPASAATLLLVVDDPTLLHGRGAAAPGVLRGEAGPVAGIVLAGSADQLPAVCDTVLAVRDVDGTGRLTRPAARQVVDDIVLAGVGVTTCRAVARRLAGLEDPEVEHVARELPPRVDLLDLLADGLDIDAAWARAEDGPGLRVPIGVGSDGPVVVDLVRDGPHALLGGTTGSGKSELLRSVVAGLAATHDPEHCTFVLVDYKGGAAFDACAELPHVVGVVTDLDEQLGARALRCLEAELRHRERRLRAAGVGDLDAWRRLPAVERGEPLPRLLVVVDEFATLRAELPDFVTALVGIAQRGRSLGVHLLLGTQRPSGAVDDDVRANTNLRVALRMTDQRDSSDVVGVGDAAAIPPSVPGRGVLRRGPAAPTPVQVALVTGTSGTGTARVRVGPVRFAPEDLPSADADDADGPSDLDRLVAACRSAWGARGGGAPRRPWPPPLPDTVDLAALPSSDVPVPVGLLDEPDQQRQVTTGWDPARGNLLVHGMVGSGTTTTLATLAVSAAQRHDPDDLHLHVLDLGRGELAPLAGLPHCGAVVTAGEDERRARLQDWLLGEARRRRRLDRDTLDEQPLHLLLVDGLATWLDELDDPATHATHEAMQRFVTDAPRLRMAVAGTVPRPGVVRSAVAAATEQRLVHRLADPSDHAMLGLRPGWVPDLPPGRALRPDGSVLQVARCPSLADAVAVIAAGAPVAGVEPAAIGSLPASLPWDRVRSEVAVGADPWRLPVGLDVLDLGPATWTLHAGDHALVLGPPSSGRSGLLRGLAALASPLVRVVALGSGDGGWAAGVEVRPLADLPDVLRAAGRGPDPALVVVDDADHCPDPGPVLDGLAGAPVHVVATARQEVVQADYGHWLRRLARSRTGLLLCPTGDVPGDLLGVHLPRRPPVPIRTGRGWLAAAGHTRFVQAIVADR